MSAHGARCAKALPKTKPVKLARLKRVALALAVLFCLAVETAGARKLNQIGAEGERWSHDVRVERFTNRFETRQRLTLRRCAS
jgi:hypothetical protein